MPIEDRDPYSWLYDWPLLLVAGAYAFSHFLPAAYLDVHIFGKEPMDAYLGWETSVGTLEMLLSWWHYRFAEAGIGAGLNLFRDTWQAALGWTANLWFCLGWGCLLLGHWRSRLRTGLLAGSLGLFAVAT